VNALLLLATWLVVSPAGDRVSVAWEWPGEAYEVDARTGRVTGKGRLPAAGPGYRLDRFAGTLIFTSPKPVALRLCREPYAAAATPDGRQIFVACLLPEQAMLDAHVAARVVIVDAPGRRVAGSISLPDGSTGVRGIAVSGDGRWAFVTHILARYTVHTTQLEQGWMNTNAVSVLDLGRRKLHATVLLDDVDRGAANPWGVAVSPNSKTLYVTHAGTDELSVIDVAAMLGRVAAAAPGEPANHLSFLLDIRRRIRLPGKGPRAVAVTGDAVWVAEYFTRTLVRFGSASLSKPESFAVGEPPPATAARRGEMLFHDATVCLQQWQSCASCHPDGRADGLNWDLMNDGIGNPKNTRSLLNAHQMGAVMWTGARPSASYAVHSGMKHILFTELPEEDERAIDAWLQSMKPAPGPARAKAAAVRGRKLFFRDTTGCAACHPPPLYTDNALHDVGTHARSDFADTAGGRAPQLSFKTPSLIEVWRTAPYLHDGRYAGLREVVGSGNHGDRRGRTSQLSAEQINDLVAFLASL
jgi:DNA-binding beta-propeller fold protein YncE